MDGFILVTEGHIMPGSNTHNTVPIEMGDHSAIAVSISSSVGTSISSAVLAGSNDKVNWKTATQTNAAGTPTSLSVPGIPGTAITMVTKVSTAFVRVQVTGNNAMVNVAVKLIKF